MPPAMFGYMRLAVSDDPNENETTQRELATYATREGFTERLDARDESAFFALVEALKTDDVKDVIVPSLWHFARLPRSASRHA